MSWAATAYIKKLKAGPAGAPITRTEKLVLLVLADYHSEDTGYAWVALRRLALECLISMPGLITTLQQVEVKGIVSIERKKSERGGATVNVYRFPGLSTATTSSGGGEVALAGGAQATLAGGAKARLEQGGEATLAGGAQATLANPSSLIPLLSKRKRVSGSEATADRALGVVVQAESILQVLNMLAGRGFPFRTPHGKYTANAELILALLKAGWTEEQITRVVRLKCRQWGSVPKDRKFLRPSTLFRASNFAGYVGELADRAQKPAVAARTDSARLTTAGDEIVKQESPWAPAAADLQALRDAAVGKGA